MNLKKTKLNIPGNITTPFGGKTRGESFHPGLDIANRGVPSVIAADAGRVVVAGWDGTGYGNMVLIDHGNGFRTRYGHLSQILVVAGQSVGRGAVVGKMGSTGRSTGPHLHFEIYLNGTRVSPLNYLR